MSIDRRTVFGNPFRLHKDGGTYTRMESIEEYKGYFATRILNDRSFRQQVEQLRGETLACWCVPKGCHGNVILAYFDNGLDVDALEDVEKYSEYF